MNVTLRTANLADRAAVDRLLGTVYPHMLACDYPADVLRVAHPLIAKSNPDLLSSGTYHLIEEDGVLVSIGGWSRGYPTAKDAGDTGHVRHVATHPDHLHKGHAGRIMRRVLDEAQDAGLARLECLSTVTARKFYAGMGFKTQREIIADIGGGVPFPAVKMEARLHAHALA
ncbi:Acetyltransferase, GNAT family [Jannaschia faecimaris]|uniref:Acetyltransferase, GNAT family n=1 Tax=Jannaschia faecimaris TaxID=1244108 RepID=A0A1H3LIH1_9RHOB|nr:GNAT family N-acetyltransferase [Jannaschia faecimaris]SDY63645.1 Acetyltransferase, GNAT family [Jannaschia faecimaris]